MHLKEDDPIYTLRTNCATAIGEGVFQIGETTTYTGTNQEQGCGAANHADEPTTGPAPVPQVSTPSRHTSRGVLAQSVDVYCEEGGGSVKEVLTDHKERASQK